MPAPKDPIKYEEYRRKQSEAHKGQKVSQEQKEIRSKLMSERRRNDPIFMEKLKNGIANREMTPEYRKKLSDSNKGKHRISEEHKQVLLDANKNKQISEATRQKMSIAQKGNTGGSFLSQESRDKRAAQLRANPLRKGIQFTDEQKKRRSEIFTGNENIRQSAIASWARLTEEDRSARINKALDATSNKPSAFEDLISDMLTDLGIEHSRQNRIGRYLPDILIADKKLIIECNGCYWHCCEECNIPDRKGKRAYDEKRTAYLLSRGYTVKLLWEHDLRKDIVIILLSVLA